MNPEQMAEVELLQVDLSEIVVWGKVPCSPAEEEWGQVDPIPLNQYLSRKPNQVDCFEVKGRSMVGAGLEPGDIIIAEMGTDPKPGQIAICLVDGCKFSVKRWTGDEVVTDTRTHQHYPLLAFSRIEAIGIVLKVIKDPSSM